MNNTTLRLVLTTCVVCTFLLMLIFSINAYADSWTYKNNMPTKRQYTASASANGKIYVMGGLLENGSFTNIVEEYDPCTDIWTTKAPMSMNRGYFSASTVNGKIYVSGGYFAPTGTPSNVTNSVEEYDPLTDTWSSKTGMPAPRFGHAPSEINGKIYIAGGSTWIDKNNNLWEYEPSSDTWSVMANMPTARVHMSSAVIDGKMYVPAGVVCSTGLKSASGV